MAIARYCELYSQWRTRSDLSMRQVHPAGEKLFVDYCGGDGAGEGRPQRRSAPGAGLRGGGGGGAGRGGAPWGGGVGGARVLGGGGGGTSYTLGGAGGSRAFGEGMEPPVGPFNLGGGGREGGGPNTQKRGAGRPARTERALTPP